MKERERKYRKRINTQNTKLHKSIRAGMKTRHIILENKVRSVCIKSGNMVEIGSPIS